MRAAVAASLIGAAAASHYEDGGKTKTCSTGEVDIQIQGVKGAICTPKCSAAGKCPTDVPTGVTATPTCALQDQSGDKYCALLCKPGADDNQCGTNASCKSIQGNGICTYDDDENKDRPQLTFTAHPPNYSMMFSHWKEQYGKYYNGDEEARFEVFKANVDIVQKSNAQGLGYTLGLNQFADMTAQEVAQQYTGFKKSNTTTKWGDLPYLGRHEYSGEALADSVDWSTKGAVTPIKNQGQCGSCWSFSTTGALEGAWEIATGKLVSVSEQQFVDCDKVDQGCSGGLMDNAFKFAEKNALCTEASYSYKGRKGTCQASSCTVGIPKGSVTGFKDVSSDSMQGLMSAVQQQPVSIAIEADKSAFQLYKSGVLSSTCGSNLDHGVLLVGYGSLSGKDYWKVKNSWGSTWGDNGYVMLEKGKGGSGECGLLSQPSYPVVKKSVDASAPATSHYEDPATAGCQSGEVNIRIQGVKGDVCAPKCSGTTCPSDVPTGVTAKPTCALQDASTGDKYCALLCTPGAADTQCGTNASCKSIQTVGICTYDDSKAKFFQEVVFAATNEVVV